MLKVKGSKIICLILSVLILCTFLQIPAGAAGNTVIGVSLTTSEVQKAQTANANRGDSFVVNVESPDWSDWPEVSEADSIEIRVDYDPDVLQCDYISISNFEVPERYREAVVPLTEDNETHKSCFAIVLPNNGKDPQYDIKGGLKIEAYMRVLPNARVTSTDIVLSTHLVSIFTDYVAGEIRDLWQNCTERAYSTQEKATLNIGGVPPYINGDDGKGIGGIYAYDHGRNDFDYELYRRDGVDIVVDVPLIAWNATDYSGNNGGKIGVTYDSSRFELDVSSLRSEPSIDFTWDYYDGYVGVVLKSGSPELDNAFRLCFTLYVKEDAAPKNDCSFELKHELRSQDGKINEMWVPRVPSVENVRVIGYPLFDGGISAYPTRIKPGQTTNITVKLPKSQDVTSASVTVGFDPLVFELPAQSPKIPGTNSTFIPADRSFTMNVAPELGNVIDMSGETSFTVTLKARSDIVFGSSSETVTPVNIDSCGVWLLGNAGNVWSPDNNETSVTVYDEFSEKRGGISIDPSGRTFDIGDTFDVLVTIPVTNSKADSIVAEIDYNDHCFDIVSLEPYQADYFIASSKVATATDNNGKITFSLRSESEFDLSKGDITFRAKMRVRQEARSDTYSFTLNRTNTAARYGGNIRWTPKDDEVSASVIVSVSLPDTDGGITVYDTSGVIEKTNVKPGESFTVKVTVPELKTPNWQIIANDILLKVDYETELFDVTGLSVLKDDGTSVTLPAGSLNAANFSVNATGLDLKLDKGLVFLATVRTRETAPVSDARHYFTLNSDTKITYTKLNGEQMRLWQPAITSDYVIITDKSEPEPGPETVTTDGLTLDRYSMTDSQYVKALITIPALNAATDGKASVKLTYPSTFTLESIPDVTGFTYTLGPNSITFETTGKTYGNALIEPVFKPVSGTLGTYVFSIVPTGFTSGTSLLWDPTYTGRSVTVNSSEPTPSTFPRTDGGIDIDSYSVKQGKTFKVYVTIPAMKARATDMLVRVDYDPDNFICNSVTTTNKYTTAKKYSGGYFTLTLKDSDIDLSSGITLTATMQARSKAETTWHYFELTGYKITGIPDNDVSVKSLWQPKDENRVDSIEVIKSSGGGDDPFDPSDDYPVKGGGISLSRLYINKGDLFTVFVNVPAISAYGAYGSVTISYDQTVFDVVSWNSYLYGTGTGYSSGYLTLNISDNYGIDLTRGITLSATLKAKANAPYGRYLFNIVSCNLRNSSYSSLWLPTTYSAYLTIFSGAYNNAGGTDFPWYDNTNRDPNYYPPGWNNNPGYNPNNGNNGNNNGNNGGNNGNNGNNGGGSTIDDLPDELDIDPDDEDEQDITPARRPDITLTTELESVNNGKVRAKTFTSFFNGDTIIYIRNTEEADRSAETALRTLRLSDHRSYAFDVSVYDVASGQYLHYLPNGGYIDLYIPVPGTLSGETGDIAVYHIQNGVPEPLDSIVVTDDGVRKIHFRANSFSPYMFVDLANLKQADADLKPDNSYGYTTRPGNSNYPPSNDDEGEAVLINGDARPANPHTGLAGWLVIPAGAGVCVFLAKRDKKRKRSKRR